jgi:hypothetical protein
MTKLSKLLSKISENSIPPSYHNNTHPLSHRSNELFSKHVPSVGPAKHLEGELLRASNKIGYDFYNNGFINDWSGAHQLLKDHAHLLKVHNPDIHRDINEIDPYKHGTMPIFSASITRHLDNIHDAVVKLVDHADKKGEFHPHPGDMYDYKKDELDRHRHMYRIDDDDE